MKECLYCGKEYKGKELLPVSVGEWECKVCPACAEHIKKYIGWRK